MEIIINSKPFDLAEATGIMDALAAVNISTTNGIAVAVNNQVVPRQEWTSYTLKTGDKITLIRATQGG